jgi:hypothetical protein
MRLLTRVVVGLLTLQGAVAPLAAQQLSDAQRSAIKSACRGDYQNVCASVPPGTKDSLQCLVQHSDQVSSGCRAALAPAGSATAASPASSSGSATAASPASSSGNAPPSGTATAAAAAPAAAHTLSPRQEAMAVRSKCSGDFQKLCSSVQLGGGRAAACLRAHASELTPACRAALQSAAPR